MQKKDDRQLPTENGDQEAALKDKLGEAIRLLTMPSNELARKGDLLLDKLDGEGQQKAPPQKSHE